MDPAGRQPVPFRAVPAHAGSGRGGGSNIAGDQPDLGGENAAVPAVRQRGHLSVEGGPVLQWDV